MKRFAWMGILVAALAAGIVGCSWETGDDATSWSSSYNWVNFSGIYRSEAGGLLIKDYSSAASSTETTTSGTSTNVTTTASTNGNQTTTTTTTETIKVNNENQGTFSASQTTFSGNLAHSNIVAGTLTLTLYNGSTDAAIKSVSDDGTGKLGSGLNAGTVSASGSWSLTLNTEFPTVAGYIRASYTYSRSSTSTETSTTGTSTTSGEESGVTGKGIYSLTVIHNGQYVDITDNNGASYSGYISQMRSTSGKENTDSTLPADGDTIIASWECTGTSAAGVKVTLIGTLQGTVAGGVFTSRTVSGTWIEATGRSGDFTGVTTSVAITATTTSTETASTTNTTSESTVSTGTATTGTSTNSTTR